MFSPRAVRLAAAALLAYGFVGVVITLLVLVVGSAGLAQLGALQGTLEQERIALVRSIRTASSTVRDTATASGDIQISIARARDSADTASKLSNDTAGTFRSLSAS